MAEKDKSSSTKTNIALALAISAVLFIGIGARFLILDPEGSDPSDKPTPTIGGHFELIEGATGNTVTPADMQGKLMLTYFGYTFCPDVCPTSLSSMVTALDMMAPEDAAHIQPIFVTVDPERDTAKVVASYVSAFHEEMIGLTGSVEQIATAAKAYKVYYKKVVEEEDRNDEYYVMDHSSVVYVMGPEGAFIRHFTHGTPPDEMAEALTQIVNARWQSQ